MADGERLGRKRVERLMRQAGISGLHALRRGRTTVRVPGVRDVLGLAAALLVNSTASRWARRGT